MNINILEDIDLSAITEPYFCPETFRVIWPFLEVINQELIVNYEKECTA